MVACPPGWGCEKIITKHFEELGLGEFINPLKADYSASMADTISRYKNGKSILFYTLTPNWSVGTLKLGEDVVWIEAPYSDTKEVKVPNASEFSLDKFINWNEENLLKHLVKVTLSKKREN